MMIEFDLCGAPNTVNNTYSNIKFITLTLTHFSRLYILRYVYSPES